MDTETTGLDPKQHCIHQIAGMIEVDGKIVDKFNYKMKPTSPNHEAGALAKCKLSWEQLLAYPPQEQGFAETIVKLKQHSGSKDEKFHLVAYNSKFDEEFLRVWLQNNFTHYMQWFWVPSICAMTIAAEALHEVRPSMKNFRLDTVTEMMEELMRPGEPKIFDPEKAHDALYDVAMCRFVYQSSLKILAAR